VDPDHQVLDHRKRRIVRRSEEVKKFLLASTMLMSLVPMPNAAEDMSSAGIVAGAQEETVSPATPAWPDFAN
jgi:hypothetical protein